MRYGVSPPPLGGVCWQPPAAGHHAVSRLIKVPTMSPTVPFVLTRPGRSSGVLLGHFRLAPAQRGRVVRFCILADDLTGADATASLLKREGLPTSGIVTQVGRYDNGSRTIILEMTRAGVLACKNCRAKVTPQRSAQVLSTREAFDPSIKRYRAPAAST
jgi:hypothetical protein